MMQGTCNRRQHAWEDEYCIVQTAYLIKSKLVYRRIHVRADGISAFISRCDSELAALLMYTALVYTG